MSVWIRVIFLSTHFGSVQGCCQLNLDPFKVSIVLKRTRMPLSVLEASTFEYLHGGQFILSTHLIKPNFVSVQFAGSMNAPIITFLR